MPDEARRIRRVLVWNRIWVCLLFVALGYWGWARLQTWSDHELYRLWPYWDGDNLRISAMTDGPFVITNLVYERRKEFATLSPPIAIIDSKGWYFTKEQIAKLKWVDYLGEAAPSPPAHADLELLYVRPLVDETRPAP